MIDEIVEIVTSSDMDILFKNVANLLKKLKVEKYYIIKFEGNIGESVEKFGFLEDLFIDRVDIGFDDAYFKEDVAIFYFGTKLHFTHIFYLKENNLLIGAILVFAKDRQSISILYKYIKKFSKRAYELFIKEQRTELYVEYQKKIDFIKSASSIFKNLSVKDLLSAGIGIFMDVFSAQAACVVYDNEFTPIGINKEDLNEITIEGKPAYEKIFQLETSFFFHKEIVSKKYQISNIFFVYEPKHHLKVVLFNINIDFIPDVEFADIISTILAIALENAITHEKMIEIKVEETEMKAVADILNVFVKKEVRLFSDIKGYGVSYPAKVAGGDFLYVFENEKEAFVCIADVCGKGYSAAVLTVVMSTVTEIISRLQRYDVEKIADIISNFLLEKRLNDRFITIFMGTIDKKTLLFSFISLGHEPAYLLRGGNIIKLEADFLPAGIVKEKYVTKTVNLKKGDKLFLYTDGVVEYISYEEIEEQLKNVEKTSLEDFVNSLYKRCVKDSKKQLDDFTCILIEI
jgi:serine phosphatase RsbU (regulator of sigma subunit)